jgi:hypothetical protein
VKTATDHNPKNVSNLIGFMGEPPAQLLWLKRAASVNANFGAERATLTIAFNKHHPATPNQARKE